ncbi:hypothetical protein Y032_0076g1001 [Ancylostoma ceylanicum]|uniref:Uncharacterized protein n=1 Tax=Ancylostoma ceylanicum TaxID=53326 RepID=A0A016TTF5_9BILA|nr:hypothetical protein Y032_0076g1001 [Ancylostoma ceylanicum]
MTSILVVLSLPSSSWTTLMRALANIGHGHLDAFPASNSTNYENCGRHGKVCLDNTLVSVQAASALVRRTSAVVYHLEDSVNALIEASKLLLEKFENTVEVTKLM